MEPSGSRRDLVVAAVGVVALSRLADGPLTFVVGLVLLGGVLVGSLQILGEADPFGESAGIPIEAIISPSVAAVACLGAIRLVPIGLGLAPALVLTGLLIDRILRTEARIVVAVHGPSAADRTVVLVEAVLVAFLAFAGVAALVPGGLPDPGGPAGLGGAPMTEGNLLLLAAIDAFVAGLLGYRVSALRVTSLGDVLWSAATYASAIAIGAAGLRAMDIPRLIGPAVLTLIFFLWDAFHGAPPSRRRDPRWIWQTVLLAALGAVVVAWNLGIRG